MYDIALIGGAGYVGNAIIHHFDALGGKVVVIDNFIYKHSVTHAGIIQKKNVNFKYLDFALQTQAVVAELQNCKSLVILGGLVGDPITKKYPQLSDQINKSGIQKLLSEIDMKLVDKRISFISTCSNYGLMTEGSWQQKLLI